MPERAWGHFTSNLEAAKVIDYLVEMEEVEFGTRTMTLTMAEPIPGKYNEYGDAIFNPPTVVTVRVDVQEDRMAVEMEFAGGLTAVGEIWDRGESGIFELDRPTYKSPQLVNW